MYACFEGKVWTLCRNVSASDVFRILARDQDLSAVGTEGVTKRGLARNVTLQPTI